MIDKAENRTLHAIGRPGGLIHYTRLQYRRLPAYRGAETHPPQ